MNPKFHPQPFAKIEYIVFFSFKSNKYYDSLALDQ